MKTRIPSFPRESGFSMVELLLTAFILGVGLLGLAALQVTALKGHGGSKHRNAAAYLASSALARLKADGDITAILRSTNQAIPPGAILANAPLNVKIPYSASSRTGALVDRFNLRAAPVETASTNEDETIPIFTVDYAVRSNAKDGDPVTGMVREVVVNVTWQEEALVGGTSQAQPKSISMSRYIRF